MRDRIRLRREEMFTPSVESALETRRRLLEKAPPEVQELSPLRRCLQSSMFYLPLAGYLGAFLAWAIMEPGFDDVPKIGGEVVLVQTDPLDISRDNAMASILGDPVKITVGRREVLLLTLQTRMEPGADAQPPFGSWREISPGDVVEVAYEPFDGQFLVALSIRPATPERALRTGDEVHGELTFMDFVFLPLTALFIAIFLLSAEAASSRNWVRGQERIFLGGLLTLVLSFVAYVPAGICLGIGEKFLSTAEGAATSLEIPAGAFFGFTITRSAAWACIGGAAGLGMNLVRSTKVQRRNSLVGGLVGGALGGLLFGILERVLSTHSFFQEAAASRLVGLVSVGTSIGVFVALVDRLAREAWLRVRTGPLAGKAFVIYKSPTRIGSAPDADIYLFKDAGISPSHALVHRIGNAFEIEDHQSRSGTIVGGEVVKRRRLQSGDQVLLGSTVLEFEERAPAWRS